MNRKLTVQQQALEAAKELVDGLDLSPDEQRIVLGMALDRFESVRLTLDGFGFGKDCLSAVFAAALEYSETLANDEDNAAFD